MAFVVLLGRSNPNQQKHTKAMDPILALMQCLHPAVTMTTIRQFSRIALAMLAMTGRVTMLGLARWAGTGGSYRTVQRFFHATLPWTAILWAFVRTHLLTPGDRYLLVGDACVRAEREHYHRHAVDALATLTTRSLTRADFSTAEHFARQQLRLEPWREEAHYQLIQVLALQGERSAALAQYETCRAILAEEFGLEPTAETSTLAQRIRAVQIAPPTKRDSGQHLTISFVGRTSEFASLVETYRRVTSDGLQVITLVGNAGMGKSRLAQQFVDWAANQGTDVLRGRAFATSGGLPYQPLTQPGGDCGKLGGGLATVRYAGSDSAGGAGGARDQAGWRG